LELLLKGLKMNEEKKPISRQENLVVQNLDDEILIYDLIGNKAYCLNQTSALIWQACDGKRSVAEITDLLKKQLGSEVKEDVVWLALDMLSKENLIRDNYRLGEKFSGLSRREAIRKIGLSSLIALPLITSLIAPLAVHANSACVPVMNGCECAMGNGEGMGDLCIGVVRRCADPNCRCYKSNNAPREAGGNCAP
jgi:hypothetical protein